MGKFDGILIVSDWDGTLASGGEISQKNIDAIRYFQGNGGYFTICSGRPHAYLNQFHEFVHPNTYTVSLNGAVIFDGTENEYLHRGVCDDDIFPIIEKILDFNIFNKMLIYFEGDDVALKLDTSDYRKEISNYKRRKIHKVLFMTTTPDKGLEGVKRANELPLANYLAVRSWDTSLEIIHKQNSKGAALKRLKEKLNAKLAIAVGDYENDIAMLEAADIGYAVENAVDAVKNAADRITGSCRDSSIADIINEIENEYC